MTAILLSQDIAQWAERRNFMVNKKTPWRVIVRESAASSKTTEFDCMAADANDAAIQACCHFEDCVVVSCGAGN